jgi:hypothetical protein
MTRLRLLGLSLVALHWMTPLGAQSAQPLAVAHALDLYDGAQYATFLEALGTSNAVTPSLFASFEKEADRWVASASPGGRDRRALVAAAVALEIAHLLRSQPEELGGRYLVWSSLLMRQRGASSRSSAERWWYLASIAGMEELAQPWVLTVGSASGTRQTNIGGPGFPALVRAMGPGGHLADALARFPNEPRFRLAQVEATEPPSGNGPAPEVATPAVVAQLRASGSAPVPDDSRTPGAVEAEYDRKLAAGKLRLLGQLPDIERAYQALAGDESLRAEVEVRVGYLEFRQAHWMTALDHLGRVSALTHETYLQYLSEYFAGRVFQEAGDGPHAIEAFERALALVPRARSAATQLAALLFVSDRPADRDRAYPLLQAAYVEGGAPEDPWRLYFRGDARLWPLYMAHLRDALKR